MPLTSRSAQLTGAGFVTAGSLVANIAAYFLHLPASRWLGPEGYGALAALLSAQLIIAVPSLALQAVVARETVRGLPPAPLRALARRMAFVVAVVAALVLAPAAMALDTPLWATAAAFAPGPLLCLLAAEQGLLQGRERFGALALVLGLAGLGKVVPALVVIAAGGSVGLALAAGAAGVGVAFLLARGIAGNGGHAPSELGSPDDGAPARRASGGAASDVSVATPVLPAGPALRTDVRTVLAAGQVQLVLYALTSVDLLLARALLDPGDAGRYALGAVAAKAAFWLPHAVGTVLYPRMADPWSHRGAVGAATAVLAGIGAMVIGGAVLAAPVVPLLVGGEYEPVVGLLWAFAALGVTLSVLQVLLMSTIAADRTADALVAWCGLAVTVVAVSLVPRELEAFLATTIAVVATTTVAAGALAWRRAPGD